MKVALLHAFGAEAGGAEAHVTRLQRLLAGRGHSTLVLDLETGASTSFGRFRQTVLEQLSGFAPGIIHLHNLNRAGGRLVETLAKQGWPIVRTLHDHSLICPAGSLFTRGRPCERCTSGGFHHAGLNGCVNIAEAMRLSLAAAFDRWAPSTAISRFLAPSEALVTKLTAAGIPARIDFVGQFVPDDCFVTARHSSDRTVVFAGRHVAGKGLDTLLSAVRGLDARVIILGTGPRFETISTRVRTEGLSNVLLPGYLTGADYLDRLRRAAIVVVPSEASEVTPTVACEAFAAGVPVIGSAVESMSELIGRNERGLLVPPGDAVALRRSIDELLGNEGRRRVMSAAAQAYARDLLSADRYYARVATIYSEVSAMARRRSPGPAFRQPAPPERRAHA